MAMLLFSALHSLVWNKL